MVGRVLTGNGITRYGDGLYSLIGAEELSDSEPDALLQLCRQRLDGFRERRGEEVFAHRSRHRIPISGSVKVRITSDIKAQPQPPGPTAEPGLGCSRKRSAR